MDGQLSGFGPAWLQNLPVKDAESGRELSPLRPLPSRVASPARTAIGLRLQFHESLSPKSTRFLISGRWDPRDVRV